MSVGLEEWQRHLFFRGLSEYVSGPNSFSLNKVPGAGEIGAIRYFCDGKAAIAFRRHDDERSLSLDVR